MSNNLREINNLKESLLRNPQRSILIGHSCYEQVEKDTIKQLCVSCGGKGYYLLIQGIPGINKPKGVITPCEECEDGFKYSKSLVEDHGG